MPITINGDIPLAAVIKFINDNDYDAIELGNGNIEIVRKDDPADFTISRQEE